MTDTQPRPRQRKRPFILGGSCLLLAACMVATACIASVIAFQTISSTSFQNTALCRLVSFLESTDSSAPHLHPADTLDLPFPRGNPPTFDPALATDTASAEVIDEVFSGLTTIGSDLQIHPDLAESWSVSDDGKLYTFKIRSDAKFADGKPITAQDFKYSFERIADPALKSPAALSHLSDIVGLEDRWSGKTSDVRGVQVINPHTLAITIDAPKVYFPARLATSAAFVVDRTNVEQGGRRWFLNPNGSGPYRLISYAPGQEIELQRNPFYMGTPRPQIEYVTLRIDSGPFSLRGYTRGELDSALVQSCQIGDVTASSQLHSELTVAPSFRLAYLGFNVHSPPFDDPQVRQAFALAIDKPTIARDDLNGTAIVANGYLAPGFPGYNPDLTGWEYNPAKARDLIRASKYGDVKNLPPIILDAPGSDAAIEGAIRMIHDNLGISIQLRERPMSAFLVQLNRRPSPFQMYSLGRLPEYPDPVYLDMIFHGHSADNAMGYANPEVDALLEQGRVEADPAKRMQLYQRAEQLILNDVPWVPLFFSVNYWLTKPNVQGLPYPPFVLPRLKYASFKNPE